MEYDDEFLNPSDDEYYTNRMKDYETHSSESDEVYYFYVTYFSTDGTDSKEEVSSPFYSPSVPLFKQYIYEQHSSQIPPEDQILWYYGKILTSEESLVDCLAPGGYDFAREFHLYHKVELMDIPLKLQFSPDGQHYPQQQQDSVEFEVVTTISVQNLKECVREKTGILPRRQTLSFMGYTLTDDDLQLDDYIIHGWHLHDSILTLSETDKTESGGSHLHDSILPLSETGETESDQKLLMRVHLADGRRVYVAARNSDTVFTLKGRIRASGYIQPPCANFRFYEQHGELINELHTNDFDKSASDLVNSVILIEGVIPIE